MIESLEGTAAGPLWRDKWTALSGPFSSLEPRDILALPEPGWLNGKVNKLQIAQTPRPPKTHIVQLFVRWHQVREQISVSKP